MSILFCSSAGRTKKVPIIKRVLRMTFGLLLLVQFYLFSLQWSHIQLYPEVTKEVGANTPQIITLKRSHDFQVKNRTLNPFEEESPSKRAYAFLVAGCNISSPLSYRNYFYNILVAASLLQKQNSSSDYLGDDPINKKK